MGYTGKLLIAVAVLFALAFAFPFNSGAEEINTNLEVKAGHINVARGFPFSLPITVTGPVAENDLENLIRFYAAIPGLEAADIELLEVEGEMPEIVTDTQERAKVGVNEEDASTLVLAWGPPGGFPMGDYVLEGFYGGPEGVTTTFYASINAIGNYSVSFAVYDYSAGILINDPDRDKTAINVEEYKFNVLRIFPDEDGWHDEREINRKRIDNVDRYFIQVTFEDELGKLEFNYQLGLSLIRSSRVFPKGSSHANLIDFEFLNIIQALDSAQRDEYIANYLFKKDSLNNEAHLYIPVKLLNPQTVYDVIINSHIVVLEDENPFPIGNQLLTWSFATMGIPHITSISPGSVTRYYDSSMPIIIAGNFFNYETVNVYFGSTRARGVYVSDGGSYLEVYLPSGSRRLEPGLYDVYVINTANHETIAHGAFSVIDEGHHIPNDQYRVKQEIRQGDVISSLKTSEDTLVISSRYRDARTLDFNLDELMGEEVLIRKLEFEGRSGDRIGELAARSKWADITIFGLSASSTARGDKAVISLGRVEPFLAQSMQARLWDKSIRSDLIQLTGENFRFDRARLSVPYRNTSGDNLKVLRYDELTRRWYNVDYYTVSFIDRRVVLQTFNPGIFVVVE
ncbi:hypothetical protein [Desulfitibacter alkalitolerans]|uniref:hypothetical protein n=1 Tax=Desulfitibacter alkalitolerans TaxID=264641 RepID=UPI000687F349|nr:hypothetical protein [Desulfitibacter alkalitolerans]